LFRLKDSIHMMLMTWIIINQQIYKDLMKWLIFARKLFLINTSNENPHISLLTMRYVREKKLNILNNINLVILMNSIFGLININLVCEFIFNIGLSFFISCIINFFILWTISKTITHIFECIMYGIMELWMVVFNECHI